MMQTKRIFLASSSELKEDRNAFEIFINRKNKDWVHQGVFIELIVWEDFLDAVSKETRLQDEYNKAIRECDIFVMLFCTKVGQYTEEDFGAKGARLDYFGIEWVHASPTTPSLG